MRILICHRPGGAFGFITDGWINALRDRGHTVQRYDNDIRLWNDFKPDVYIGCSGHKQNIPAKRSAKIAIHVNPYGPVNIEGINESKENIKWVMDQKADVVFGYGTKEDEIFWSYWTDRHAIPWIPMPTAGDKTIFLPAPEHKKIYDFIYLGGRWPYKAQTIDKFLLPVLKSSKSYRLHGWGDWPAGISQGLLSDDMANEFLGSGKIGPCISEAHTQRYGIDIPERAFKLALCNTLIVHDPVIQIKSMIPSSVVASSAENYIQMCEYYSKEDEKRKELVNKQREEVLKNHTYHNRMSALLHGLGFEAAAKEMLA